ncbi:MAG: chloride channel protein [Bacteroidota bacterium]|nr:chloride channel protein [Bacteroidota bacterium]
MVVISLLSILIAILASLIAKVLVYLIYLITNLSFFGKWSLAASGPATHTLGLWIIIIPAIGGWVVGLMALYGSKAIRGHGIPEAMEQILTNKSRIPPVLTYLKPLSSAIAIGTGGPFGAEGPIIATGGALGSTIGQMLKITDYERKILLTAGSTAGMSAIFGSPVAAIFLGIELLLFEFSPRSILPVALACITGAAGHYLFFGPGPVFKMDFHPGTIPVQAMVVYSGLGLAVGLFSVAATKLVYLIEDYFEKIPVHWMWWPAMGGLVVGLIGYFYPHTLGVGYDNIIAILSGKLTFSFMAGLCVFKFISWSISLGSGTSGGTLAPLFIIGGATGALLGSGILRWLPQSGVALPVCALVGMAAMFAGASRAFLTSIIFAIETTGQTALLLPVLAGCTASFLVSFFLMKNTIMTEKISRRGIKTPDSYEPDFLEETTAGQAMTPGGLLIGSHHTMEQVRLFLHSESKERTDYLILTDERGKYRGLMPLSSLYPHLQEDDKELGSIDIPNHSCITSESSLKSAVEKMALENVEALAVLDSKTRRIMGILQFTHILDAYRKKWDAHQKSHPSFSLKLPAWGVRVKRVHWPHFKKSR